MLPSRGFKSAAVAFRASRCWSQYQLIAAKDFSSSSSSALRAVTLSSRRCVLRSSNVRPSIAKSQSPRAALISLSSLRFQSTTPSEAPLSANPIPALPENASGEHVPRLEDLLSIDPTAIPERLGFLKELGLDFGWGPTSVMQFALEHVHVWGGMPWWGSIIATGVLMRIVLFRFYIYMSDNSARQRALAGPIQEMKDKLKDLDQNDMAAKMAFQAELSEIYKSAGIKPMKSLMAPLLLATLGFGSFRLMRAMAALPVPGLETGGLGWLQDLTVSDPYYVLPVVTAGLMYLVIKQGGEAGISTKNTMDPRVQAAMMYGMPALVFAVNSFLPAALQLHFLVTSTLGGIQGRLFKSPGFRNALGMASIVQDEPLRAAQPEVPINVSAQVRATEEMQKAEAEAARATAEPQKSAFAKTIESALSKVPGMDAVVAQSKKQAEKKGGPDQRYKDAAAQYETRRAREIEEQAEEERQLREWQTKTKGGRR